MLTNKLAAPLCALAFTVSLSCASTVAAQRTGRRAARAIRNERQTKSNPRQTPNKSSTAATTPTTDIGDEEAKTILEATLALSPSERVSELEKFVATYRSFLRERAIELLVSARAAAGDNALATGDTRAGIEYFKRAIADAPTPIPERLFVGVIAQIPSNLFLRGQTSAAIDAARLIETKVADDPRRLLAVATFYIGIEAGDEAVRVGEQVIQMRQAAATSTQEALQADGRAPDTATLRLAYLTLGAAERLRLRLDDAAVAYTRALELDPQSANARRSLADLRRALGKPEEALALYEAQLVLDPTDTAARTGVILARLDMGKRDEAERELASLLSTTNSAQPSPTISSDAPPESSATIASSSSSSASATTEAGATPSPSAPAADQASPSTPSLALLVGASYWYAAQGEGARALELAARAVKQEPRYTWAQIAFARAALLQNNFAAAEQALRIARRFGSFATLDYELASVLAAAGLYTEAAEELARSATILPDARIQILLAGRIRAQAADFRELLAPERRAAIFQFNHADTEANARFLHNLLAFHTALKSSTAIGDPKPMATNYRRRAAEHWQTLVAASEIFAAGDDAMRFFRQLYVAEQLLNNSAVLDQRLAAAVSREKPSKTKKRKRSAATLEKPGIARDTHTLADARPSSIGDVHASPTSELVLRILAEATDTLDSALDAPHAITAALAEALRSTRADAIAAGTLPEAPTMERRLLSSILRGRVEDAAGLALLNEGKTEEAVTRFRRALGVLPADTAWARNAQWHLGTALEADGQNADALAAYLKAYDPASPDIVRRAILKALYRKVNGSLEGLELK